jgi:uncharacterized protein with HEPN domain
MLPDPDWDSAAVLDMVVAGRRIRDFIQGLDFKSFSADLRTQSAVLLQLLILGEAAKRLSAAFRAGHTEIGWSEIMKMRDKLIHHYEEIDLGPVWKAATEDVPELLDVLERLVSGSNN